MNFRPFKDYKDLYEFVIVRNDDYDAFQGVFSTFPDMKEYSTGDLYSKHPTKQGYWRSCCRCDDIIAFSNGEKLNPVTIEGVVSAHPAIEHALVNGHGRFQASLLLKSKMPLSDYDKDTLLDDVWLTVQRANQDCPTHGRVTKHLIMFAVPEKPMVKTAKNTVKRKETLELYQDEFDALYAAASHCSTSLEQTAFDVESAESLRKALRQLISTNTTIEDVTDTADLFQQGLDSLQVMTLVKAVNAFFTNSWPGFRPISSKTIYANSTISKLESAVRKSTESKFVLPTKDHEHEMEGYLSRFASGLPYEAMSDRRGVVLLTGSAGSLGSYLLGTFISDPEVSKVYCLNRAHNGLERQKKSFEDKGLPSNFEKVEFVHCDMSKEMFGLDSSMYLTLRESVTQIVHNAWEVNFNLSIDSFEPNISGVCQLIRFCLHSAREPFIFFISSLEAVRGWSNKHVGMVPEITLTDWSVCGDTGYAKSKMLAERLLDTSKAGVRSVIFRVGQIAGPIAEKGIWSKQEWLPSAIASSMYLGKIPYSLGAMDPIDWIPVDSLSLIIKDLIRTTTNKRLLSPKLVDGLQSLHNGDDNLTSPRVYHLSNPFATSWSSLLPSVLAAAPGLGTVSLSNWVDALRQSTSQGGDLHAIPAVKMLSFFEDLQSKASCGAMPVVLDNRNTIVDCPGLLQVGPVNTQMMDNWMRQWAFQG
jgi:thioester reductase-like protein